MLSLADEMFCKIFRFANSEAVLHTHSPLRNISCENQPLQGLATLSMAGADPGRAIGRSDCGRMYRLDE